MLLHALRRFTALTTISVALLVSWSSPAAAVDDYFTIPSALPSHNCLDNDADTNANPRGNVQLYKCRAVGDRDRLWQKWAWIKFPPGNPIPAAVQVRNQMSGRCLTYQPGAGTRSPVWMEACGRPGQGWIVHDHDPENGNFVHSYEAAESPGLCLDVKETGGPSRSGIDLWPCDLAWTYGLWYGPTMATPL